MAMKEEGRVGFLVGLGFEGVVVGALLCIFLRRPPLTLGRKALS